MANDSVFEYVENPTTHFFAGGTTVARIGPDVKGKRQLLAALADQLSFPSWFGENWDALEECLLDILPNQGRAITLIHDGLPADLRNEELTKYLELLQFVARERADRNEPPVKVVFPISVRRRVQHALKT